MDDDELVEQIRHGNKDASDTLIRRHYTSVLRYCRRHCPDMEKAEDLTQETFFRFFKKLSLYNGERKFKAYLYTIANRLCIDESRKARLYLLDGAEPPAAGFNEITQIENRVQIDRLLDLLSPEQKNAVLLRFGAQLSYLEISKATGCAMRTAQSRIRNALKIMRKELRHD